MDWGLGHSLLLFSHVISMEMKIFLMGQALMMLRINIYRIVLLGG